MWLATAQSVLDTTSSDLPRSLGTIPTNEMEVETIPLSDFKQTLVNALSLMHSRVTDVFIPSSQQALSKLTNEIVPTAAKSALQGSDRKSVV